MRRMQWLLVPMVIGLILGCADAGLGHDVRRSVTAAALDSVPRLDVREEGQLCEADGRTPCPLHAAIANWLDDGRFALWEPGGIVEIRSLADTTALPLDAIGAERGKYVQALAVGLVGGEYIVVDGWRNRAIRFNADRAFHDESPFLPLPPGVALGFVGHVELRQALRSSGHDSATVLEVRRVRSFADTSGDMLLQVPVESVSLRDGVPITPLSLFPILPVYTIAQNGDVVWSAADRLEVERRSSGGTVRWQTAIDVAPVAITPQDIAARQRELKATPGATAEDLGVVDSSAALTRGVFPSVGGVILSPAGQALISGPIIPTRDSVDFYLLARNGALVGRFRLGRRTQVLLLAGDSLLVHQPTRGEPWEVRWLRVEKHR